MDGDKNPFNTGYIAKLKDADSYTIWAAKVSAYFDELDLLPLIDGSLDLHNTGEQKDETKIQLKTLGEWKRLDRRARNRLLLGVDDDLIHLIEGCKTARAAWIALEDEFRSKRMSNALSCLQQFLTTKFVSGSPPSDLRKHFAELKRSHKLLVDMMKGKDFEEKELGFMSLFNE